MYAQMIKTARSGVHKREDMSPEEQKFQDRIDAGEKIEPKDWMPDDYRATLIRQIESQGLKAESAIIDFRRGYRDPAISSLLNLEPAASLIYLETLKSANDWPVAVCIDLVPESFLAEKVDPHDLNISIFEGLQGYHGINIRFAECDLIPAVADAGLAGKLKIEARAPLLLLEHGQNHQVHAAFLQLRIEHRPS